MPEWYDGQGHWPATIPAVRSILEAGLDLPEGVTLLIGENGSGKSTIVEAVAMAFGLSPEGGSRHAMHSTRESESELWRWIRLERSAGASRWGFFLRAETMHGFYTYLEENPGRDDPRFHELSHGESFLEILRTRFDLGPETDAEAVATALDEVAIDCSPYRDQSVNPAKMLAVVLADSVPIVWGGSVLAARAARRVAESIRRTSGRAALAADAEHLLPVIGAAATRDVFADPFADEGEGDLRPALVILDDGSVDASVREQRGRLVAAAQERRVRVETVTADAGNELARYASLLATGTYAAAYLGVGLDHPTR